MDNEATIKGSVTSTSSTSSTRPSVRCGCKRERPVFGRTDDKAAVALLPEDWIPKHSSPALANYLKQQQLNHENHLECLSKQATLINECIDGKVKQLSEILLAEIQQNERDIDQTVAACNVTVDQPLTTEKRNEALVRVQTLCSERVNDIAVYKRDALALERERADCLRKLMRDQFQKLIGVCHLPPKDLLHDFDERTYDINQQLLSNCRAYTELEVQLRLQADDSVVRARSTLNQFCLGVTASEEYGSTSPRSENRHFMKQSFDITDKKGESFLITHPSVQEVEEWVSRLVEAYRKALIQVLTGFTGKLLDLHSDLTGSANISTDKTDDAHDVMAAIERSLHRLSSCITTSTYSKISDAEETQKSAVSMKKSLLSLGDQLKDTYTILRDAGHLWDAHMLRSALAQKLTIAAVEDLLVNHDTIQLAQEVVFNIALEQLCGSSDVIKLQYEYDNIVALLNRIAEMYKEHNQAEVGRLEEFMKLPPTMANTLLAEFYCFLEKHPRHALEMDIVNEDDPNYVPVSEIQRRSLLPRAILQTELQEIALKNWRNGFLEAFETNASLVPDELTRQSRTWVDERSRGLHMRYSVKLLSHSIRLERVKAARDARFAELTAHSNRLESHLAAIYDVINRLPEIASTFLSIDAKELYPLCEWIDRIIASMDEIMKEPEEDLEKMKLKMYSYASRLSQHRSHFEKSLDLAIKDFKSDAENRIQECRVSNIRFVAHIRLFNERGMYSAAEALKASAALMKGADGLDNCLNRTMDNLSQRRAQLLAQADQAIRPLEAIVEKYVKVSKPGKNVVERKTARNK